MANWSFTVNSQFRPFELSELMPLYQANAQAQYNAEEAMSQLQQQAAVWERLKNSAVDADSYAQYKAYKDDIDNQMADLMNNGLNGSNRRNLMRLRAQYQGTFKPMEEAYNRRQMLSDTLWKLKAQDNDLIVETDPSQMSLNQIMNNPSWSPRVYSGKMITARVAQQMQTVANRISELKKIGKLDKYYDEIQKSYGLSPQDVDDFLNGKVTNSFIKTVIDNTLNSTGINTWTNKKAKDMAYGYAAQGIYSGIGKSDIALQRDLDVMTPMEQAQYQGQLLNNKTAELNNQIAELQLQQSINPQGDYPSLLHDEGELSAGTQSYKEYNDLKKELYVNNGKGGLSQTYATSRNHKNAYINPMLVYEEYAKIANESGWGVSTGTTSYGQVKTYGSSTNLDAYNKIKKKFGVDKILTKEQYERLKEMGYTSKSSRKDFYRGNFENKLNSLATLYRPTSTSMAKYDFADDRILNNLNANADNLGTRVYEYKRGKAGSAITDIDDILSKDKNGVITTKIKNISYSVQQPDKLLITLNDKSKKFFINPYEFSSEAGKLLEQTQEELKKAKTNKEKSELQDYVTDALRQIFMNYKKVRTETDANI